MHFDKQYVFNTQGLTFCAVCYIVESRKQWRNLLKSRGRIKNKNKMQLFIIVIYVPYRKNN